MILRNKLLQFMLFFMFCPMLYIHAQPRIRSNFNKDWKFYLGDEKEAKNAIFDDSKWRSLKLPHDWSIEMPFDSASPTGIGGGALRGGIGWYRKTFILPVLQKEEHFFIEFDGVYRNSEVWINGHYLGMRPNGYISFEYDITPYLKFGQEKNVISVKVDNAQQPNSRWYSGSGIYRNVWLVSTGNIIVDHWGTFVTTPKVAKGAATVNIKIQLKNLSGISQDIGVSTIIYNANGKEVARTSPAHISIENKKR